MTMCFEAIANTLPFYQFICTRYGSHCQECMGQVKSVIPCSLCTGVSFCSMACRDQAAASYHRFECGANNILTASGLNIYPALTLRLISRYISGLPGLLLSVFSIFLLLFPPGLT